MLDLIYPMGSVLASWLALFLLFSGLGNILLRLFGWPLDSGSRILDSFWLGWLLSLGLLQLWHFVFPVNDLALLLLAALGAVSLYMQRQALRVIAGRLLAYRSFWLFFGSAALWLSNRSLGMPIAYDTGYRDIQAVMWIDSYRIVPGLANLFPSFAYNHSVYLYDALLDSFIWSSRSFHLATGLLLMVYLAYAIHSALRLYRSRSAADARWSWLFATFTIPYILYYTVAWGGITHFLTDTVVDLLGFLAIIYLLDFLQYWRPKSGAPDFQLARLAILILTGFTIKQTFIVFGLAIAALVFYVWLRRGGASMGRGPIAALTLLIGLWALSLLLPWMARGVITSGYIAYPQSIGRIEVDWALPAEHIEQRQRALATNTRWRGADQNEVLNSWTWLLPWLERLLSFVMTTLTPAAITLGSLGFYALGAWRNRSRAPDGGLGLIVLLPLCMTLVIWFISFPNDKYVRYVFWGFGALSLMLALFSWPSVSWPLRLLVLYALTALCLVYVLYSIIQQETWPLLAGPDDGFYAHFTPPIKEFETDSGLIVNVPDSHINQCWHIPLPCTPAPAAGLSARVPGEIGQGFRIQTAEGRGQSDG